jgi:light-regulated signal transduction histidine kinase (bacteriophytochrome)
MSDADADRPPSEIDRLREALDEETQSCIGLQRQLDRTNQEFEEFVSVASHNLRESLRDVTAYSQLIAETYAGSLDAEADAMLQRIQSGASNMESLLTDIVDYWTLGPDTRRPVPVDMEAVLHQTLLVTDKLVNERGAILFHDPLPEVKGDFESLSRVLRHLIRNAIEYCGTPPCQIHISCRQAKGEWVFSVRDNGPGIEPSFQERIFGAFMRLHGKEHPGNGLGLAFCRKAIELQGGRMWIESAEGAGSTFYFTLPCSG